MNINNLNKIPIRKNNSDIILTEYTNLQPLIISTSYFLKYFLANRNAKPVSYLPYFHNNLFYKIKFTILKIFKANNIKIFNSLGIYDFVYFEIKNSKKYNEKINLIHKKIKSKKNLEDLTVDGILIGDLIYDYYLRYYSLPTVDIHSFKFKKFLFKCLLFFEASNIFISTKKIKALNVTHCCYLNGIVLRQALKKNIPCFLFTIHRVFRLNINSDKAWMDFKYLRENFLNLDDQKKNYLIEKAKNNINKRLNGEVGVDMFYSTKSAFNNSQVKNQIKPSSKIKILVAPHCFLDSTHVYGNNLFTDFYEWMNYLGQLSKNNKYDWYIKTHPDFLPITQKIINNFLAKYPNFNLISPNTSHHQIKNEGIDFVLTVYGSVGFEYAVLGTPVINASINNPHFDYNFNINPKNIEEYSSIINNLDKIKININSDEIYQFYATNNLIAHNNFIFEDFKKIMDNVGGYNKLFTSDIYNELIKYIDKNKNNKIMEKIDKFVKSNQYTLIDNY